MPFFKLDDGSKVEIILPREQAKRLRGTCFRGAGCRQAGNFFRWSHFGPFIHDPDVKDRLKPIVEQMVKEAAVNKVHRIELEFDGNVGWDSVMHVDELDVEDLAVGEVHQLNKRASALFLPTGHILAPQTPMVTLVMRILHRGHWRIIIETIYPGPDAGEFKTNMTKRFGLVWLGWDNPGE